MLLTVCKKKKNGTCMPYVQMVQSTFHIKKLFLMYTFVSVETFLYLKIMPTGELSSVKYLC